MTEESLLQGKVSENGGGFYAASRIASMGLNSCALHLETVGVCLVASLLEAARSAGGHRRMDPLLRQNAGLAREKVKNCISKSVDIPSILYQVNSLLFSRWKTETGRIHLQGLTRMLSAATT